MNLRKYLTTLICLLFAILSLNGQEVKKVLIIGMDGCRSDALEVANTPNLDNLRLNGVYSPDALNEDITISGPGWSAILCGVRSDKHLVTGNNFSGNDYENYPSMLRYVEEFDSNLNTLSICHWAPINDNIVLDYVDTKINVSSDEEVASVAIDQLTNNNPDVAFLHFDEIDGAGHGAGFSPTVSSYIAKIEEVDTYIGTVVQAVAERPNFQDEDWLIIVTTDHGGIGTTHGGNTIEEKNVFMIVSGNQVIQNTIRKDSTVIQDNVFNCLGDSVELSFAGGGDHIRMAPNANFDFGTTQDFSIEVRVRTSVAADVAIVGNKDWDSGLNPGFVFSFKYPSGPEWKVNIGDGTNRADINTGGLIADGLWHSLAVTFDRDGFMKMYEDGNLLDSADISFIGDITTGEGLFLGSDIDGGYSYNGAMAELRIWDTVLSQQSIEDWACTPVTSSHPSYSNLQGYWKMNDGLGTTELSDASPNSNMGMLVGPSWNIPDSIIQYDYTNTPRLVDVPPTAFHHMCIPIKDEWALDGNTLIPACQITNISDLDASELLFNMIPNPASNFIILERLSASDTNPIVIEILNGNGKKVYAQTYTNEVLQIDISSFDPGIYIVTGLGENNALTTYKLIISR